MEINDNIKRMLLSINGRSQKYGEFAFSRYEFMKYGVSENKMRAIINELRKGNQYLQFVRCEKWRDINGAPRRRNIFIATEKLLNLVKSFSNSISDMNNRIIRWCHSQNPIQTLRDFGLSVTNSGRIGEKKSKITVNKRNGAITDWKTGDTWNLFNYLRDLEGYSTIYFFTHFIGK